MDRTQPTYVLGGWLVSKVEAADADQLIASVVRQRHGTASELKASRLLRSTTGRDLARTLIDSLLQLGCRPAFSLYEKRWMLAAKLIEWFCDPRTNARVHDLDHGDALRRVALGEQIYQLPVDALEAVWAAARRSPSIASSNHRCDASVRVSLRSNRLKGDPLRRNGAALVSWVK